MVTARERFIGTPPKQSSKIQTKSETVAKVRDQTTLSVSSSNQNTKISWSWKFANSKDTIWLRFAIETFAKRPFLFGHNFEPDWFIVFEYIWYTQK